MHLELKTTSFPPSLDAAPSQTARGQTGLKPAVLARAPSRSPKTGHGIGGRVPDPSQPWAPIPETKGRGPWHLAVVAGRVK